MALKSLNRLTLVRETMIRTRSMALAILLGVKLDFSVRMSLSGRLLPGRRGSIRIGKDTMIAFKSMIYTYDALAGEDRPVTIGDRCFIGGGSLILPGVTIGDECIVGAGAVVFEDVPPRCIVGGNPARILRRDIEVMKHGRLTIADDNSRAMWGDD
jgi:maltose O-acetyltransferase